jgi:hypothetical protein
MSSGLRCLGIKGQQRVAATASPSDSAAASFKHAQCGHHPAFLIPSNHCHLERAAMILIQLSGAQPYVAAAMWRPPRSAEVTSET